MSLNVKKPRLIVIVGPTGVGKTKMALRIAKAYGSEIISADSMQVYRYMNIGTAKPDEDERALVHHNLIDVVNPDETFNAAMYTHLAREAIEGKEDSEKTFFVVGGTGLYIKALVGGMFSGPGACEDLREHYRQELQRFGKEHLYGLLKKKDKKAAEVIDPYNPARIIRALEVWQLTGKSITEIQKEHCFGDNLYHCLKIGLKMERGKLFERIERRTEGMIACGLVDEVKWLLEHGYHEGLKSMQSLGYRHMASYLRGECSMEDAVFTMIRDTRHYAKRQMTWFSADRDVEWFGYDDIVSIEERIKVFLAL
jgi:tRNA dimethylallyltransferase